MLFYLTPSISPPPSFSYLDLLGNFAVESILTLKSIHFALPDQFNFCTITCLSDLTKRKSILSNYLVRFKMGLTFISYLEMPFPILNNILRFIPQDNA